MPIIQTIENEAKQNRSLILDLDKWRYRCTTQNKLIIFPHPEIYTLEKNLYFLLRNSIKKDFQSKYRMKPSYLSKDEYGTTVLDKMLMYVNNCFCLEDFDFEKVYVPSLSAVLEICQDKVRDMRPSDLIVVDW